jgi:monoamine oxidase
VLFICKRLTYVHCSELCVNDNSDYKILTSGYVGIVNALASGVDVRLTTVVASVERTDSGVVVSTTNGDIFAADYAIMTVPLGVLQRGSIACTPPLPGVKQAAIDALKMGVLDKVFMLFGG